MSLHDLTHDMYLPDKRALRLRKPLHLAAGEVMPDRNGSHAEKEAWMRQQQAAKLLQKAGYEIRLPPVPKFVSRHPNSIIVKLAEQLRAAIPPTE